MKAAIWVVARIEDFVSLSHRPTITELQTLCLVAVNELNKQYDEFTAFYDQQKSSFHTRPFPKNHPERKEMDNTIIVEIHFEVDSEPENSELEEKFVSIFRELFELTPSFSGSKLEIVTTP